MEIDKPIKPICGIYKITSPSDKVYIGQSRNILKRWGYYRSKSCKSQRRLYFSISKYGIDKHKFEVIEECEEVNLDDRERFWQEKLRSCDVHIGLNSTMVKSGSRQMFISAETRRRMSESQKGKTIPIDVRNKISKSTKGIKKIGEHQRYLMSMSKRMKDRFILNTSTGIYYDRLLDAADSININHKNLHRYLTGQRKNKTEFIYT